MAANLRRSGVAALPEKGQSLLEKTLGAAVRDRQTVSADGKNVGGLIDGMSFREIPTHADVRGSIVEIFDQRWNWHSYDVRPTSSTYGQVRSVVLSQTRRGIVNVPKFVWHADRNIGSCDVVVVNLPTLPYDHASPDKYRLPIDTH